MAKIRMVTRTISITTVTVLCAVVSARELVTKEFQLTGKPVKSEALCQVKSLYETNDFVPTAILSMTTEDVLYGMSEEEFMLEAEILPSRAQTRKENIEL